MSAEDLVIKIKEGQTEYIQTLWENVAKFIDMQAGKYLDSFPEHYRVLREDMVNQSYFYFLRAIEGFKPGKGGFLTYLNYCIKSAFTEVLYSGRGSRLKNEPLNQAISIDIPIDDTEDLTLTDLLIDETSEAYYRRIEDKDFWNSVYNLLKRNIEKIKDPVSRDLLMYMLDNNCKVGVAIKFYGYTGSNVYEKYRKALRKMRELLGRSRERLEIELTGLDDYLYGYGTGITAFERHIFTSSVELETMLKVDRDMERRDIKDVLR